MVAGWVAGTLVFFSCSVRILLRFTFRLAANGEGFEGRVLGFCKDRELGRFVVCVYTREFGFGDVSGEVAYLLICFAIVFL
jgi:hypothetical protein